MRSVVEYASQVWNSGLTQGHIDNRERVQTRALHVIFPDVDYDLALQVAELQTLEDRCNHLDSVKFARLKLSLQSIKDDDGSGIPWKTRLLLFPMFVASVYKGIFFILETLQSSPTQLPCRDVVSAVKLL